jgi:hypothetical protein
MGNIFPRPQNKNIIFTTYDKAFNMKITELLEDKTISIHYKKNKNHNLL